MQWRTYIQQIRQRTTDKVAEPSVGPNTDMYSRYRVQAVTMPSILSEHYMFMPCVLFVKLKFQ